MKAFVELKDTQGGDVAHILRETFPELFAVVNFYERKGFRAIIHIERVDTIDEKSTNWED